MRACPQAAANAHSANLVFLKQPSLLVTNQFGMNAEKRCYRPSKNRRKRQAQVVETVRKTSRSVSHGKFVQLAPNALSKNVFTHSQSLTSCCSYRNCSAAWTWQRLRVCC